jgi:hypothetical protein
LIGGWSQLQWLAPLAWAGFSCHYWLDGASGRDDHFKLTEEKKMQRKGFPIVF